MKKGAVAMLLLFLARAACAEVYSCSVPSDLSGAARIGWIRGKLLEMKDNLALKKRECYGIVSDAEKSVRECWNDCDKIQRCINYLMAARDSETVSLEPSDNGVEPPNFEEFYSAYEQQASEWMEKNIKQRLGELGFQVGTMDKIAPNKWRARIMRWHPDKVLNKYKDAIWINQEKKVSGPVVLEVGLREERIVVISKESLEATPIVIDFDKLAGDFLAQ